jgi:putative oxidoreductase
MALEKQIHACPARINPPPSRPRGAVCSANKVGYDALCIGIHHSGRFTQPNFPAIFSGIFARFTAREDAQYRGVESHLGGSRMAALNRVSNILEWILLVLLAALFVLVGTAKFGSHNGMWVQMFGTIGIGQWFRVFTGGLEIVCALLLLIPRAAAIGAALLSCTMVGAFIVRVFILRGPARDDIVPLVYLALLLMVLWRRRQALPWRGQR